MPSVMRVLLVACLLVACRAPKAHARDASAPACARVGQTCEVAPGKLGTCVEREACETPPCFVCQSQH
jgi:hypothetical protein